jgi:uncharacterized protein (TIGR02246 family)
MVTLKWAGGIVTLLGFAAAVASTAERDDAVSLAKSESKAFVRAFNERKASAAGALFTETADFAFLEGSSFETLQFGPVSGREQITAAIETFQEICPSARLSHSVRCARFIAPDVMLSDEDFEIAGLPDNSGPITGRLVVIRVRTDGAWRIAAERTIAKDPPKKP